MGLVNDVVSYYVCHLVPVCCVFTVSYFILIASDYFTLIGVFHSSNELYSWPDFELGMGSLGYKSYAYRLIYLTSFL